MTTKTTRTIFVAVLALGLIGSTVALSQNVTAQTQVGKDIVRYELPTFDTPEIKRMTEIAQRLNDQTITETERNTLITESTQIKESFAAKSDIISRQSMKDKESLISDFITEKLKTQSFDEFQKEFPLTGLYVDDVTNQLVINVDSYKFSDAVVANVLQQVREVVGQEVDLVVQPMPPTIAQCSQTSDCEPAQGGVKISTSVGPCSVGFKATHGVNTGFVTAGHCTNGNTNVGVGQPDYFFWDDIGTVTANSYKTGTTSDALFVDASENISDKIYSNFDVNWAGGTSYLDGVTMEGHVSKGVSGVVVISSYSNFVGSIWVTDMAATNYVGQGGDSGAPVYGYVPSNNLKGTHSGYNGVVSAYSKQANTLSEISGLSWKFN